MPTLYGIRSCDTVRRARRWLDGHGIAYTWHDLREDGLDAAQLQRWVDALGIDALLNRKSRTWRDLPSGRRERLDDAGLQRLVLEHPTLLRRPLLEDGDELAVGFSAADYAARFDPE